MTQDDCFSGYQTTVARGVFSPGLNAFCILILILICNFPHVVYIYPKMH